MVRVGSISGIWYGKRRRKVKMGVMVGILIAAMVMAFIISRYGGERVTQNQGKLIAEPILMTVGEEIFINSSMLGVNAVESCISNTLESIYCNETGVYLLASKVGNHVVIVEGKKLMGSKTLALEVCIGKTKDDAALRCRG